MNYRKSILSLASIVALNATVMADPTTTYVPLTTKVKDRAWVMFGVNEFSNGTPSDAAANSTFTTGYSKETDTIGDNLATEGFPDSSGSKNMGSVQALDNSVTHFTDNPIVAIKSTDLTFSQTEPERTMYISIVDKDGNGGGTAKIKLNYKASLEGRDIEIQINGDTSTIYRTKVSQTATFNNPAPATNTSATNSTAPKLSKVDDVLAYDLSNSPVLAAAYSKNKHQFATDINGPEGKERFYHYDAANQKWLLWDRAKTGTSSNDFADFTKGQAYWGRIDLKDGSATPTTGNTNNARSIAGVVLGKNTTSSYADPSVYAGKLTPDSWNMISFDPANNPDIRNAATGMIVDVHSLGDGDHLTITDETGVNSITILFTAANGDIASREAIAKHINESIESAKFLGELPSTFNIKAFATDADAATVFISDKKFTIKDPDGKVGKARTLTNDNVFDESHQRVEQVDDVDANGTTSIYSEYAMIMEPLVGAGSASGLDHSIGSGGNLSARVQFGTIDGDSKNGGATSGTPVTLADNNANTNLTTAATKFTTDNVFNGTTSTGKLTQIDTDFDGTPNMLLAASRVPFYAKDNTYTRVYAFHNTGHNSNFTIKASDNTVIAVNDANTTNDINSSINAKADDGSINTGVYASVDSTGKLIVVSAYQRTFGLLDADSADDNYFNSSTSTEDIAKGAIKRVINIAKLARTSLQLHKFVFTFSHDANASGTAHISINGIDANDANVSTSVSPETDDDRIGILDKLVTEANKVLKDHNIAAYVSRDYTNGLNDITKAKIDVEGDQLQDVNITISSDSALTVVNTTATDEKNATAGKMSLAGTTIVDNLKDNAVYTPDYVNYGPLYTLKKAGYEAKAIIRPSTDITATTTHWDVIDLTRASKDWLKNNEFNLFSVDNSAGYWVYLTSYTNPNSITISNPVYTPYYSYHFINDGGTNNGTTENIIDGGQFSVEIAGITEATSNVKAIVDGKEIELTREGGSGDTYSATITSFETGLAPSTSPIEIGVRATDGVGESLQDLNVTKIDYTKPVKPTVTFNNGVEATFDDNSTDVATYYLYENYIPDNYASPIEGQLSEANASTYNICAKTPFGTTHHYKLLAVDGTGELGKTNASDIKSFTYTNLLSGATVLTHTAGDTASTITAYDTSCATTTANTGGVDITSLSGSVRMSFVSLGHNISNETDLPWSVFYDLNGDSHADVKVSMIPAYAGHRIYIQKGTKVYTATLPADEATADGSFSTAIDISTPITADNQTLAAQ